MKGMILKYYQLDLYIDHLSIPRLIYLNTSHSLIQNIITTQLHLSDICTLLVVDFRNNKLVQIHFLKYSIFTKIIYLDVSFNIFISFHCIRR